VVVAKDGEVYAVEWQVTDDDPRSWVRNMWWGVVIFALPGIAVLIGGGGQAWAWNRWPSPSDSRCAGSTAASRPVRRLWIEGRRNRTRSVPVAPAEELLRVLVAEGAAVTSRDVTTD
jgi:hypothetical protein